jgi:hypothetical protein
MGGNVELTATKGEQPDVIQLLINDVESVRSNLVGKWIFMVVMLIFLAVNAFLWSEMRTVSRDVMSLRAELASQVLERLKQDDVKRDQILTKMDMLSGEIHELKGALDTHVKTK